ncbi:RNA polymerase sigma factor [Sphingobacterium tabacisoli]|uniref:RNA polymerase sigma factor n=1 Tax=Sphingobacterium tabacisoli TaxID=2044855 RepID=A0ABW5L1J8_9SPHI|nr:sigma-70 family RNA polymerase sigma factor [Sphingobacterium tabacisoli]
MESTNQYFQTFKDGQQSGLEYYVHKHIKPLTFFAYRLVKNEAVSEEIVGDSFLKIWEVRDRIENPSHLLAYLYKITKNACLKHLSSPANNIEIQHSFDENLKHPDSDILTQIVHAELIQQLYQEIERLPGQQGVIFRMSYLEGYTTEEICTALNTTTSNVFYAKSKALSTLRIVFKKKNMLIYLALLNLFS